MRLKRFNEINENIQYKIDSIQRIINELKRDFNCNINIKTENGEVNVKIENESVMSLSGSNTYDNILVYLSGLKQGLHIKK